MNLFENTCSIVFFSALSVIVVRFSLSPFDFSIWRRKHKKIRKKKVAFW